MNSGTRAEHYLLFAISFIAVIWFFISYPAQDPRSAADVSFTKNEIELRAAEKLSELGFSLSEYTISEVRFASNPRLLDSLQHYLGRSETVSEISEGSAKNIKPYYWEVIFERNSAKVTEPERPGRPFQQNNSKELLLRIDAEGRFAGLVNEANHLPQNEVRRNALSAVFVPEPDSAGKAVMAAVSDSLLGRLLYFDMQKEDDDFAMFNRKPESQVQASFRRGIPYRHSVNDARALADFYLSNTGWDKSAFNKDTVFIKRVEDVNAANVRYASAQPVLGQHVRLDVVIAPTGSLLQLRAAYNPAVNGGGEANVVWGVLLTALIFLFGLAGLFIFFFRMRARAIDTRSALLAAVVMGFVVPIYIFLGEVNNFDPFSSDTPFNESLILFFQMGVVGALSSIGFFVLVALSDSITRQHWPEKLSSYDYLRQGMLFNKPIGSVVLRSVALAFILAGFWTLLLQLFPALYINIEGVFMSERAAWPPVYLLLQSTWFSFGIMLAVFLAIGSQVYGRKNNIWAAGAVMVIASGVLMPVLYSFGPPYFHFILGGLLGIGLTFIYIRWDFLTLLLSHFLFLGLLGTTTGWMITDSPDAYIFYSYIGMLVLIMAGGMLAIFKGKEEQSLPDYIPEYVEELAQEQRIKQELEIAREVQQSFLPTKTPAVAGLDIAAVCKPAYETGGDYYDFIQLDEHRVAIAIGDVSGKGIQAAFYMTFVKGLLHSLCRETDSPAELLKKINRLFYENATKGTFISLVYGVLDLKENVFTFARAGHNPVLHINRSTGKVKELQPGGLGIGLTKDKIFDNKIEEIKLTVTENDLFLLYTDGIVEALNQAHQFYGTHNLIKLIKKQKNKSANAIVSAISKGVTSYIGKVKQHDDMTLMAIRFKNIVK